MNEEICKHCGFPAQSGHPSNCKFWIIDNGPIMKTQEQTITEAAFDAAMKRVEDLRIARLEKNNQQQWLWFKGFASVVSYHERKS